MESPAPDTAAVGLILAGGRSGRFGSDKATATLKGLSLLEIAAQGFRAGCRHIAVSAQPDSSAAELAGRLGLTVFGDRPGDPSGPLAGIRRGLDWARSLHSPWLAVRAVDTPFLPEGIHDRLIDIAVLNEAPAAFCCAVDGPQPLCSVWRPNLMATLDLALADGRHPAVHAFLEQVGAAQLGVECGKAFANLNTSEALARAQSQ